MDDTLLCLLLPYFYLRKGLVWPVSLAQPSVTTSSADFSFQNLIFCQKLSKDTKNSIWGIPVWWIS
jgi:hypothetical protein